MREDVAIYFYVYHNEFPIFKDMIIYPNHAVVYSHYVIISHVLSSSHKARDIINEIPKNKLLILDKWLDGIEGKFSAVDQNFEQNIFDAIIAPNIKILKYEKINTSCTY